ncbi:MAG: alpha/beta hydrolase [Ktedonobacteraceae bacterium]
MLTHTPSTSTPAPVEDTSSKKGRVWRRVVAALLTLSVLLMVSYTGVSFYIATQIQIGTRVPINTTPSSLGLQYKDVTFPSRYDNLQIKGWFIPGILPNGKLTSQRTILIVHGIDTNRVDPHAGVLNLCSYLAHHGFAILAFDLRGNGESPAAPRSFGLYEQRDVLGAVDFLHSGPLPFPELGRTKVIAAWSESMGGATAILATANEPAIKALVSDSSYADVITRIERDVPAHDVPVIGHVPAMLTPGGLVVANWLYGVDYYDIKPVEVIASIAPRPILLIHGADDNKDHKSTPPADMYTLAAAALSAPNANVQVWMVPGAVHAQAYHVEGQVYVDRIVAFYNAALGPDTSGS